MDCAGEHCETTALLVCLQQQGHSFTEAQLFGLGRGLSFFTLPRELSGVPFFSGRIEPGDIIKNLYSTIGYKLEHKQFSSLEEGWAVVENYLNNKQPIILRLNTRYLEHFSNDHSFAGHFLALTGIDVQHVHIQDTAQQGGVQAHGIESMKCAWAEDGLFGQPLELYHIDASEMVSPSKILYHRAMKLQAQHYLEHAKAHIVMHYAADDLLLWPEQAEHWQRECRIVSTLGERGGTGGANFRKLFNQYLIENETVSDKQRQAFADIVEQWHTFYKTLEAHELQKASDQLHAIADEEKGFFSGF